MVLAIGERMPILNNHYLFYPIIWPNVIIGVYRELIMNKNQPQEFKIKVYRHDETKSKYPKKRRSFPANKEVCG